MKSIVPGWSTWYHYESVVDTSMQHTVPVLTINSTPNTTIFSVVKASALVVY